MVDANEDDRAVQVVPNTGRSLAEEHVAELSALRGKAFKDDYCQQCGGPCLRRPRHGETGT